VSSSATPLISVIVSTYKSERYIRKKLENLVGQSIVDKIEIIIIDSGSPEGEHLIIKEFLSVYPQIKYIRTEERETLYAAWNRGIRIASGKYITNSNTDDLLTKNALETLSAYLLNNPHVGLVYADQILTSIPNIEPEKLKGNRVIRFPEFDYIYMLERCIIGSQPMWRADVHFKDAIWFDESFEVSGDHEFELRVADKYPIAHLESVLGTFYKSPGKTNKETENFSRTAAEVARITLGFTDAFLDALSAEAAENLLKKYLIYLRTPILLYIFTELAVRYLTPNIYKYILFHSVEFTYWFVCKLLIKLKRVSEAAHYCDKYLRYKKSDKIDSLLLSLQ